jgi:hypothetical protein
MELFYIFDSKYDEHQIYATLRTQFFKNSDQNFENRGTRKKLRKSFHTESLFIKALQF